MLLQIMTLYPLSQGFTIFIFVSWIFFVKWDGSFFEAYLVFWIFHIMGFLWVEVPLYIINKNGTNASPGKTPATMVLPSGE